MGDPFPSPDERYVAIYSDRPPRSGVYLVSLRDASQTPVGPPGNRPLGWSRDGRFVYVWDRSGGRISRVPVRGGQGVIIGDNPFKDADCGLTEGSADVSLLCTVEESVADAWVMENFDPTGGHPSR
jgi:sugar lactone lactonase YvrE